MTETVEAISPRDLRDAGDIRISAPQSAVHLLHPAKAAVAARAHAQALFATLPQQAVRHTESRADLGHEQEWLGK
jgi:hypothetical protein